MDDMIVFASRAKLGCCSGSTLSYATCHYLERYKKNRETIRKNKAWKTEGAGAAFQGRYAQRGVDLEELDARASVNGIAFAQNNRIVYSLSVESYSGIFLKNPMDDSETEGHIIHDNKTRFLNLDYNDRTGEMIASIQEESWERHLALFENNSSRHMKVTEGECLDENPVWGKADPRTIYYDSAGIGRDHAGRYVESAEKVINRLALDSGTIQTIAASPGHDCFSPKVDGQDCLYFIKRPHQKAGWKGASIKDILLIPYRLAKAVRYWFEFFSIRYTGEPLTSAGANPAQAKSDPKQVMINGNIVNAEQALRENRAKGEKYPGIAPRNWELMRQEKDGSMVCLKKGVIDFDVTKNNELVYSNGKYLILIDAAGAERVIDAVDMVGKVRVK
jgi:hypothetical protein